jgi:hypothetical protein
VAHTAKGRALTEDHRRAQAAVSTSLVDIITDLFLSVFSPADIDGSSAKFMESALPVVLAARDMSTEVATTYLDAFRRVELQGLVDSSELTPDLADPLSVPLDILREAASAGLMSQSQVDQRVRYLAESMPSPGSLAASLHSSGAAVAKRRIKAGDSVTKARDTAAKAVAAKAMKLAADGGRAPLLQEVNNGTNGAVGYARVIDADPCPFCSMLASRGAVYRSDAFAASTALFSGDGRFKVHDGCGCTLEPVYGRRATDLPAEATALSAEWAEIAAGQPDPWGAWRRWRESGTRPGEERKDVPEHRRPSAPRYGRSSAGSKGRKAVEDLDAEELAKVLKGMYVRRAGLEEELAGLESRGQSIREPGPAASIHRQLERLNRQISTAERRTGKIRG